jgi:hypothetical protein
MERRTLDFDDLEVTVVKSPEGDIVCRLGRKGDQPERASDSFYPSRDYGFLWFRDVDGHLACSGLIHEEAMSDERLRFLVDHLAEKVLLSDDHVDFQVELVGRGVCRVESGEESLRFSEALRTEVYRTFD